MTRPLSVILSAAKDRVAVIAILFLLAIPATSHAQKLLDTVHVTPNRQCRSNDTEDRAISLWIDARTQLLTAIAQEPNPADTLHVGGSERATGYQTFRVPSMTPARAAAAARTALEHFLIDSAASDRDRSTPSQDDPLLGASFTTTHCFKIERHGDNGRDTAVVFELAKGDRSPIRIEGTLWIYSSADGGLHSLEFRYVHPDTPCFHGPEGLVSYQVGADGTAHIIDWWLNCPPSPVRPFVLTPSPGAAKPAPPSAPPRPPDAWDEWNSASRYIAGDPTVTGTLVSARTKHPLVGVRVTLTETGHGLTVDEDLPFYSAATVTDSAGRFTFSPVRISNYKLEIVDTSAAYRSLQPPPRPNTRLDGGYISIYEPRDTLPHNIIFIHTFRTHASRTPLGFDHPPVFIIEWPRP